MCSSGLIDAEVTVSFYPSGGIGSVSLASKTEATCTVADWNLHFETRIDESEWSLQTFEITKSLGALSFESEVRWYPVDHTFGRWDLAASLDLAKVAFLSEFRLDGDGYTTLAFLALWEGEDTSREIGFALGCYRSDFVRAPWAEAWGRVVVPFQDGEFWLKVYIDSDRGFRARVGADGIPVPNMPHLLLGAQTYLKAEEKSVTTWPQLEVGDAIWSCIEFDLDIRWSGSSVCRVDGFEIGRASIACDIGAFRVEAAAVFEEYEWFLGEYCEYYRITSADDPVWGPIQFDATIYFKERDSRSSRLGLVETCIGVQVLSDLAVDVRLGIDVAASSLSEMAAGLEFSW